MINITAKVCSLYHDCLIATKNYWHSRPCRQRLNDSNQQNFTLAMAAECGNCDGYIDPCLTPGCKRQSLVSSTDRPRLLTLFT